MKKYYIEISYKTGDSFNTYDSKSTLELQWDNLSIVKENLKRIQDHHKWHEDNHGYRLYSERGKPAIKKPKFIKDNYSFKLLTDERNEWQIAAFWCGYFETLYSATVKENRDPELAYVTSQGEHRE